MTTYDEHRARRPVRLWWEGLKLAASETWHRWSNRGRALPVYPYTNDDNEDSQHGDGKRTTAGK